MYFLFIFLGAKSFWKIIQQSISKGRVHPTDDGENDTKITPS